MTVRRARACGRKLLLCALVVAAATVLQAAPTNLERYHLPLTGFLRRYVVEEREFRQEREILTTRVRYGELKADSRWTSYTENLAQVDSIWLRTADENDLRAFWINTYNAFVIDTVVRHYPIRPTAAYPEPSIRAIDRAWTAPHVVAGREYSLEDMEKILDRLGDGRVWFLVCPAAAGGPMLRPYAMTPSNVEQEMESACGSFCNDRRYVRLDTTARVLRVSDYLREHVDSLADPVRTYISGSELYPASQRPLVDTLLRRWPSADREYVRERRPAIEFFEMDWSLNDAH
jgi:hypothetical protein